MGFWGFVMRRDINFMYASAGLSNAQPVAVPFKIEGIESKTPCPVRSGFMVGSWLCARCAFHVGFNIPGTKVECRHPAQRGNYETETACWIQSHGGEMTVVKFKLRKRGWRYSTPCFCNPDILVGTEECSWCPFYESISLDSKWVICSHPEQKGEKP